MAENWFPTHTREDEAHYAEWYERLRKEYDETQELYDELDGRHPDIARYLSSLLRDIRFIDEYFPVDSCEQYPCVLSTREKHTMERFHRNMEGFEYWVKVTATTISVGCEEYPHLRGWCFRRHNDGFERLTTRFSFRILRELEK